MPINNRRYSTVGLPTSQPGSTSKRSSVTVASPPGRSVTEKYTDQPPSVLSRDDELPDAGEHANYVDYVLAICDKLRNYIANSA